MSTKVKFVNRDRSTFFATARQRVDAYFKENEISTHANTAMWMKACFFLGGYVLLYTLVLWGQFTTPIMLGLAALLGMFAAFIGFNVSHDALHGAFSSKPWVNRLLGGSFYLLGANPYVWKITHNVVHHTYTNIPGHDEDIEIAPGLVRLDADEKLRPWHKYQHLYTFPLYSLASLSWVFRKDYMKFFKKNIGASHDNSQHPRSEYYKLFIFKALYYLAFLVIPYLVLEYSFGEIFLGFLLMHAAKGIVLGLVFQLAHVVEGTDFPVPDQQGNVLNAWAVHQLYTTANFAPKSSIAAFLCGGLNRQVEHHLFPKVCHIHYPAISGILKQTALEYGLPYLENETFLSALVSHYKVLKQMGQPAAQAVSENVAEKELAF